MLEYYIVGTFPTYVINLKNRLSNWHDPESALLYTKFHFPELHNRCMRHVGYGTCMMEDGHTVAALQLLSEVSGAMAACFDMACTLNLGAAVGGSHELFGRYILTNIARESMVGTNNDDRHCALGGTTATILMLLEAEALKFGKAFVWLNYYLVRVGKLI